MRTINDINNTNDKYFSHTYLNPINPTNPIVYCFKEYIFYNCYKLLCFEFII